MATLSVAKTKTSQMWLYIRTKSEAAEKEYSRLLGSHESLQEV
jgi:hypothetical protein